MSKSTDQAYHSIRNAIENGRFEPGDRLNEEELSEISGVSRTPVREALRRLSHEHLVTLKPNRGAFVTKWSSADLADFYEMRAFLEGLAARKAAERGHQDYFDKMDDIVDKIDVLVGELRSSPVSEVRNQRVEDHKAFLSLNSQFHEYLLEAANSPRLRETLQGLSDPGMVTRTALAYSVEDIARSNRAHRELAQAIRSGDGTLAEHLMRVHLLGATRALRARLEEKAIRS